MECHPADSRGAVAAEAQDRQSMAVLELGEASSSSPK